MSASSSKRWLNCTPSARLEEQFTEDTGSVYAEEGTAAHALAEHKLKRMLKRRSKRPVSDYQCDEMEECTDGYVAYAMEQIELAKQNCKDPVVLVEQRLDFSRWVPGGFGTGDCLIVADKVLHIIDFKYGLGILVDAEDNPQMKCYALGALDTYDGIYDIETVRMTIFQPRRENISTSETSKEALLEWAENYLKPTAELAYNGQGDFQAGDHCQFCKVKADCRRRAEYNLELARYDFEMPANLEDTEISAILAKVDELVAWANDIKEFALRQAQSGTHYEGWKVVEGRSNRRFTDDTAVADAVTRAGYDPYEKKLLGITAMTSLLGKKKFEELLGGLIQKPPGKPTLVPESDKRPAMNTAQDDFSEN